MPQRRQPATLLALCHSSVASHLASTCRMLQVAAQESPAAQVLSLAKRRLRPRFLATLPGSVRVEVLEKASKLLAAPAPDGSAAAGSGPAPLYLLALLLAPDVKHLKVELCCYYGCSHQAALLRLLATEGSGLLSLELARSALLRLDRGLLKSALTSATGLRRLVLRNIAGDAVLQVIGSCCPVLEVLDVAHSRQVTDQGLRSLLINVELMDKGDGDAEDVHGLSTSPPQQGHAWPKLKILSRIMPWLRGETRHGKRGDRRVLLQYCERRNDLCRTLQTLDIANTGITSGGILLALHRAPALTSLGDYAHTGRALEVLERVKSASTPPNADNVETFGLVGLRSCRTTPRRLELISKCCPALRSLALVEPKLTASAMQLLPANLTSLGLHAVPADAALLPAFYSYLRHHGASLNELNIRFANPSSISHEEFPPLPMIDLPQILAPCPRLRTLVIDNAMVDWLEGDWSAGSVLPCLRSIQLGRAVSARVIGALLTRAPGLKVLHLHTCPDLTDTHLGHIARHNQSLQCFYVYEARRVTGAESVSALISSCRKMVHIGNLANWGLDCDSSRAVQTVVRTNNLQLEMHSGAHWFCSPCVQTSS